MTKKNGVSLGLSFVFLMVAIHNFFRDLPPLQLFLNSIGFSLFLILIVMIIRKECLGKSS